MVAPPLLAVLFAVAVGTVALLVDAPEDGALPPEDDGFEALDAVGARRLADCVEFRGRPRVRQVA